MPEVEQPLNLPALARSAAGIGQLVPGTPFEVWAPEQGHREDLSRAVWLLVLEGDLIIDLPYGDFRHLRTGEAIHLTAGITAEYQPLEETVVLRLQI